MGEKTTGLVLEIWRTPIFSARFGKRVEWQSTRVDLRDGMGATLRRVVGLTVFFLSALGPGLGGKYTILLTRAMGPVRYRNRILLWLKVGVGWTLRRLLILVAKRNRLQLVVLDIEDNMNIHRGDAVLLRAAELYYKRELAQDYWLSLESTFRPWVHIGRLKERKFGQRLFAKLRPLPLSAFKEIPQRQEALREKIYDVFFVGRCRSIRSRELAIEACGELDKRGYRVLFSEDPLTKEDYISAISSSWLCLSPAGNGWDCYRHYEVASQGGVAVMNYPRIFRYQPYLHGDTCLYYDDQDDLVAFLEKALDNRVALEEIGKRAAMHYERFHTVEKVFEVILSDLAQARPAG